MNKKFYPLIAGGAALALALTGCGKTDPSSGSSVPTGEVDSAKPVAFTVGADEYAGYNNSLSSTYSTGNSAINDRMMTGFGYFQANGEWKAGTDLGSYEKTSDSPLTIKYTINEKAVYQGGTPITCEDYYLDWVAQNPQWILDAQKAAGNVDKNGEPLPLFDHVSGSDTYALPVADGPQCEAGDREFTITYSEPNPDWELVISGALPSHVMAKKVGISKEDLFKKLKDKDFETAKKVAEAWNGWIFPNAGELPADLSDVPSFGPFTYKAGGWTAGQYITLVRNPDWWGEPAGTEELVVRMIAPEAQLQALQNGDVNIIEPQATQDTLSTLKSYSNVTTLEGPTMIWEHLDFNFADTGIFSDSKGGKALREAFAYCVPRQQIVDTLIKPLNPDAKVLNLREYFNTDAKYDEVLSAAYDGRYDSVDLDKAKEKIAESGVSNPTVRIGYSAPNQRRADTVAAIKASCDQAGFTIEDVGSPDFFKPSGALATGQYDVALFAWSGSGQKVSGANIYMSTGQQNFGKYANATVDSEWKKCLTSLDDNTMLESKKIIEKELWDTLFGIPLYTHPGIAAYSTGVENVERNITQSGIMWNAEKWVWKKAA